MSVIRGIDDDFCRIMLIATLEGRHPDAIYRIIHALEPALSREDFDLRMEVCRRKLWETLMEDGNE